MSSKGYTTREVAEVLGLSASTILSWARSGLLTPERSARGAYVFSFQDLVLLRSARELLEAEMSARRVRRALAALREQLPAGRPLSAVRISALGDRILVRDGERVWEPDSGQLRLDLGTPEERAVEAAERAYADAINPDAGVGMNADDWYDAGVDLEAISVESAAAAYRRALEREPSHRDAHLNLGRLLHEEGRLAEAESHYRAAAAADPGDARAHYNIGVALEDQGRAAEAVAAYREALRLDEALATAHFNLSRLYEAQGDEAAALSHLAAYKRLLGRSGVGEG